MPVARLRITPRTDRARKQWRDDRYFIDSILHEGTELGGGLVVWKLGAAESKGRHNKYFK